MALPNVTPICEQEQSVGSKAVDTRIGKLDFEYGVPTRETRQESLRPDELPARLPALSLVVPHRGQFAGQFGRHHRRSPR